MTFRFSAVLALGLAAVLTTGAVAPAAARSAAAAAPPASCPTGIGTAMGRVDDYWIAHHANPTDRGWITGAYFTGDLAAATALGKQQYTTYAQKWASTAKFSLAGGGSDTVADDQAAGQTYLELYNADPAHPATDIAQITQSVQTMADRPAVDDWWWVDALFMAMPDFAKLGALKNNTAYFDKMYALFHDTKQTRGLWDANKHLWWRDGGYTGKNIYWSRGNGWAFAALARVLDVLPSTDPHRAEYVQTLQQMAAALKTAQRPSGFWPANLGDAAQYPGPETSGTAFFTYGLSWGINHGILDAATYTPVATKAWKAMAATSVQADGSLGYVQGVGADPSASQPVTAGSTAAYGVGGFLLAGSQLAKLCGA
jgi:unsaturated rhamnogalacturonyl hydrolase